MFRIRCIYDVSHPINRRTIEQVQDIIRTQVPDMADYKIREIPEKLNNPMKYNFRSVLFVCDGGNGKIKGFALFSAEPALKFGFLDLLALGNTSKGGGVGAALYQRVVEECISLGLDWLFFECLTDLPEYNPDSQTLKQNQSRLRFYERMGARPVINTQYELPRAANAGNAYFLMVDDLQRDQSLDHATGLRNVEAILKRKYKKDMTPTQIRKILDSFKSDPVDIRPFKYIKQRRTYQYPSISLDKKVELCVSDAHSIHHIKDHGYVELPVRLSTILDELERSDLFERIAEKKFSDKYILDVHDRRFYNYFKEVALSIEPERSIFPDVFPIRRNVGLPKAVPTHAGYYCIDIYSPINRNSFLAARNAVNVALTTAQRVERGSHFAYALVRPPGHHAGRDSFGGYCYLNSSAIAANYLSKQGRVVILDLDYHHGNGQQEIFYHRNDVFTISIHADPAFEYPYFSGYASERGELAGEEYNLNLTLKKGIDGDEYTLALQKALKKIRAYKPDFLVIALGLDTAQNDPSGTWRLVADDFENNGRAIGGLSIPTLVVQEGGYDCAVLGKNALSFFNGLWNGFYKAGR